MTADLELTGEHVASNDTRGGPHDHRRQRIEGPGTAQGKPIRVGMVGAGFMGQGLTNQIIAQRSRHAHGGGVQPPPGARASTSTATAGCDDIVMRGNAGAARRGDSRGPAGRRRGSFPDLPLERDRRHGRRDGLGRVRRHVILEAFQHGKPVVLMNAEVDATIGPILQVYARKHDVILSACDGDEPGVQMNLFRWVRAWASSRASSATSRACRILIAIPTTQQGWAERWGQNAAMVTSFADGSKISFEQSIVANATGFKVRSRGMSRGLKYDGSIMDIHKLYDLDEVRALGGIVDYTVGPPA